MATSSQKSVPEPMETKLLEVDSDLAAQEAQLTAQLEALQEKRKSLQTVIHMFAGSPVPVSVGAPLSAVPDAATPALSEAAPPQEAPAKRRGRQKGSKVTRTGTPSSVSGAKPRSSTRRLGKKSEEWEPYLKPAYRDRPLTQAVLSVLQQYPNDVVKVPFIMETLLVRNTPKEARSALRHRLSNVLTVGLKKEKWYRGGTGTYSVSKAAATGSMS